jgi:hypothetical protein
MKSTNYRSNWNINRNKSNTTPLGWIVLIAAIAFILYVAIGATENYSEGERIGFITKFSKKGRFWKSWEGELNLTQTGMNTSSLFDFSLDNDTDTDKLALKIDSTVNNGWKVKLTYHQVFMKNWFSNRGETDYFIRGVEIIDKQTIGSNTNSIYPTHGRVIDTVFVVIDKNELLRRK